MARKPMLPMLTAWTREDPVDRGATTPVRAELRAVTKVLREVYDICDGHHLTRPCSCRLCTAMLALLATTDKGRRVTGRKP